MNGYQISNLRVTSLAKPDIQAESSCYEEQLKGDANRTFDAQSYANLILKCTDCGDLHDADASILGECDTCGGTYFHVSRLVVRSRCQLDDFSSRITGKTPNRFLHIDSPSAKAQGTKIYYTTDGSQPSEKSLLYKHPLTIESHWQQFKAIAIAPTFYSQIIVRKFRDDPDSNTNTSNRAEPPTFEKTKPRSKSRKFERPASSSHTEPGADLYNKGINLYFGMNGLHEDKEKAFEIFCKSYEQGNQNAAYMVGVCYRSGDGVIKDWAFLADFAHQLYDSGFIAMGVFLIDAYNYGFHLPFSPKKAKSIARNVLNTYQHEDATFCNDVSLDACCAAAFTLYPDGGPALEKVTAKNLKVSKWSYRYGYHTLALLLRENPNLSEIYHLVQLGCAENDALSQFFKASIHLNDESGYANGEKGIALLQESAVNGFAEAMMSLTPFLSPEEVEDHLYRYWVMNNFGSSKHVDKMKERIMVFVVPPQQVLFAYHHQVMEQKLATEEHVSLISYLSPTVGIQNASNRVIHRPKLQLCFPAQNIQKTIRCDDLAAGTHITVNVSEHGIEWEGEFSLCVQYSGGQLACFEGCSSHIEALYMLPALPIVISWKKGTFGGYILNIIPLNVPLYNVVVRKVSGATSNPINLLDNNSVAEVGWFEFSDSSGLKENEIFFIDCPGYPSSIGKICLTEEDPSSSGIGAALLAIGGGALAALGG